MTIDSLMIADGDAIYYTEDFRHVLEDHMPYLREHSSTKYATIQPDYAYANRNDLYALLTLINIPKYLHWVVMRMNNWTSPQDFNEDVLSIIIPDPGVVQRIKSAHTAGNRIS